MLAGLEAQHGWAKPYSMDLRGRVVAAVEIGGESFAASPSGSGLSAALKPRFAGLRASIPDATTAARSRIPFAKVHAASPSRRVRVRAGIVDEARTLHGGRTIHPAAISDQGPIAIRRHSSRFTPPATSTTSTVDPSALRTMPVTRPGRRPQLRPAGPDPLAQSLSIPKTHPNIAQAFPSPSTCPLTAQIDAETTLRLPA